ncbi:MAG: hypothetical protein R2751_15035 [Bacteroidales bacterium]
MTGPMVPGSESSGEGSASKLNYEEKKELEKKIRKATNRVKALEHEVEGLEAELAKMDDLLMDPANIKDMSVYEDYEQLKRKLDESMANWEKQTLALEKLVSKRN